MVKRVEKGIKKPACKHFGEGQCRWCGEKFSRNRQWQECCNNEHLWLSHKWAKIIGMDEVKKSGKPVKILVQERGLF